MPKKYIYSNPWFQIIEKINSDSGVLEREYDRLNTSQISDNLEDAVSYLALNNILFFREANYKRYQVISQKLFDLLFGKNEISKQLMYKFCLFAVYSDYPRNQDVLWNNYVKTLSEAHKSYLELFEKSPTYLHMCDLIQAYVSLSQFYLFNGDVKKSRELLERSILILRKNKVDHNLILFARYHYVWSLIEQKEYSLAMIEVNRILNELEESTPILLHLLNTKSKIFYRLNHYSDSRVIAEKVKEKCKEVFSSDNQDVYGEVSITIGKCLIENKKPHEGIVHINEGIKALNRMFNGEDVDPSQATARYFLARAYEEMNDQSKAKELYLSAKSLFEKLYKEDSSGITDYNLTLEAISRLSN